MFFNGRPPRSPLEGEDGVEGGGAAVVATETCVGENQNAPSRATGRGRGVNPLGGPTLTSYHGSRRERRMNSTLKLVAQAIRNKQQIVAVYNGHRREMCPHAVGYKDGRPQGLFFQFAGTSSKGLPPGGEWRCIPLLGLTDVQVRDGEWHTADQHSRRQSCVDDVIAEVIY